MGSRESNVIYGLLARVYSKEPAQEFLRSFRTPFFLQLLGEDFKTRPIQELAEELAVEYTRLFIGPGRHIYPYESRYRNGKENIASQVKNLIESHGLRYNSDFCDSFDHISVEFEFMEKIIDEEAKARRKKDRKRVEGLIKLQRRFIDEHLIKWVPEFSDRVINEASLSFYKEMARLTKEFILLEGGEKNGR